MLVDARLRLISKDPDAALAAGKHLFQICFFTQLILGHP